MDEGYAARLQKALDLAQKGTTELANGIGVAYQTIYQILKGPTKSLSVANHARAARFLGVDAYWLATGEGVPRPESATSFEAMDVARIIDSIEDPVRRRKAYAFIVQAIELGNSPPSGAAPTPPPGADKTGRTTQPSARSKSRPAPVR